MKHRSRLGSVILLVLVGIVHMHCKKHVYYPTKSKAVFKLECVVGGNVFAWDNIQYQNKALNKFGVTTLQFYLSGFEFKKSDGATFKSDKVFYLNPENASQSTFSFDSITPGVYSDIYFYLGVDDKHNITGGLDNTTDNLNMAWPDMMGGGYHFLKMEGHFLDSAGVLKNYAIHLGKKENKVSVHIQNKCEQRLYDHSYKLVFNLNEVFENPYMYDLNVDPTHTMIDSLAMLRISQNLQDAFSIEQLK